MKMAILIGAALVLALTAIAGVWLWTPDKSRDSLERSYLTSPDDLIEIAGTILHVRDTGPRAGPAIILVHGFGSHLQTWDGWVPGLAQNHRVIRFDLPGSGLSQPDPTEDYSDDRAIEILVSLMKQLNINTATLIGNSLGGRIVWTFAASHPERVGKLILVSPDGFASPGFEYGKPAEVPGILNAMKYTLPKGMLRSNLAVAYHDKTRLTDETVQRYHDLMRAPGARPALIERMRQTVLKQPEPLLESIEAPVLLLWGEHDGMIPVSNAADYENSLRDVQLIRLPNMGHVPQEEAPERSLEPVVDFLRKR